MPQPHPVAVLADIHGNDHPLAAVPADLAARPHAAVVAGDLFSHGPRPREALARRRALAAPTIHDNTDRSVLGDRTPPSVTVLFAWTRRRPSLRSASKGSDAPLFAPKDGACPIEPSSNRDASPAGKPPP